MKRPLIDIALEEQMLSRREPRHTTSLAAFRLAGTGIQSRNNTEFFMSAIDEEKYSDVTEPLPFDFITRRRALAST